MAKSSTNVNFSLILCLFWTCLVKGQLFGNSNNGMGGFGSLASNGFGGNSNNFGGSNGNGFGGMNNGLGGSGGNGFGGMTFGEMNNNGFGGARGNGFGGMNNNGFGGSGGNGFGGMGGNGFNFNGQGQNGRNSGGISEAQRETRDIVAGLNQLTGSNHQIGQGGQAAGLNTLMALLLPESMRDALAAIGSSNSRNRRGPNQMGGNGGMNSRRGTQIRNAQVQRYFGPNSMLSRAVRAIVHPNANPTQAMINIAMGHQGPPSNRAMMMEYMPHFVNLAYQMGVRPDGVVGVPTRQQLEDHVLKKGLGWMNGNNGRSPSTSTGGNSTTQSSGPSPARNTQTVNTSSAQARTAQTATLSSSPNNASTTAQNVNGTAPNTDTSVSNTPPANTNASNQNSRTGTSNPNTNLSNTQTIAASPVRSNTGSVRSQTTSASGGVRTQQTMNSNLPTNTGSGPSSGYSNQNNILNVGNLGSAPNVGQGSFNQPFELNFGSRYTLDSTTSMPFVDTTSSMLENMLLMQLLMPNQQNPEAGLQLNFNSLNAEGGLRLF